MAQTIVTWEQFEKHIYPHDCWVMQRGNVYNLTDFLVQHPGGDDVLISGIDSTKQFEGLPHSGYAISIRNSKLVGKIESETPPSGYLQRLAEKKYKKKKQSKKIIKRSDKITKQEIALHNTEESCWIILNNKVIDATTYLYQHPGGVSNIMKYAGQDATAAFRQANHSNSALALTQKYEVGQFKKQSYWYLLVLVLIIAGIGLTWNIM